MRRSFVVLFVILLVFPIVQSEDSKTIHVAYCEHMGYSIEVTQYGINCVFDTNTKCNSFDFYKGICSQDKVKPFKDRLEGESVYLEFEKCAEGLSVSQPSYLLEQPSCYKPNFWTWIEDQINSLF